VDGASVALWRAGTRETKWLSEQMNFLKTKKHCLSNWNSVKTTDN
jgi:hypothetical protein